MKKITRKGSGRTKGSFSFVQIKLSDLTAKFPDQETLVMVGRKWAESKGFVGLTMESAAKMIVSVTPAGAIAVPAPETPVAVEIQKTDFTE